MTKQQLDEWNRAWRQSGVYQDWMRRNGLPGNGMVRLSEAQRRSLMAELRASGVTVPNEMHIDPGGNLNTRHGFAGLPTWAKIGIGAGAAATGFGLAGLGPLGGVLGLGGSAPAGAALTTSPSLGGSLASTAIGPSIGSLTAGIPGATLTAGGLSGTGLSLADLLSGHTAATLGKRALGGVIAGAGRTAGGALTQAALAGLSGLPALLASRNQTSPEERALEQQILDMLKQQQARTEFQNPLHEAVTRMAGQLLPRGMAFPGGSPYGG